MRHERFQVLDGWRGICALLVALYHLNAYGHFYTVPFVRNAWLFVDFFFVLSGFVITHAYMGRVGNWREIRAFVIRRFGRLWPLHVSILLVLMGLEFLKAALIHFGASADHPAFTGDHSVESIFTNVLLIQSLGIHDGFTWNVPSWSISTEFYTYIVFAAVFMLARRDSISLLLTGAIALLSAAVVLIFSRGEGFGAFGVAFFRTLYGFFIGHLTYRLWQAGYGQAAFRQAWFMESLAVASIVALLSLLPLDGQSKWCFAAPFLFAFVVWVFAHERGPVSRLMNTRPVAILGERSYSIYMVHAALVVIGLRGLDVFEKVIGAPMKIEMSFPWAAKPTSLVFFGNAWVMDGLAAVYLLCVVLIAGFTYKLIEHPGRTYFNKLEWTKAGKSAASASRKPVNRQADGVAGPILAMEGSAQGAPADI